MFAYCYANPMPTGDLLERFGLGEKAGTRFGKLSGGQQQRLSVVLALVGRPRIAFLDELTTGLDPAARREIWAHLAELRADGVTMLLVTHSMEEAAHLCDRVMVIDGGRVTVVGGEDSPQAVVGALAGAGIPMRGLRVTTPSLDDAYLALTETDKEN